MGVAAFIFVGAAVAVANEKGEELYNDYQCSICHGAKGNVSAHMGYPLIAGQETLYLYSQLVDIRDGGRDNGRTNVMRPMMHSLTNENLRAIAEYLNSLPWVDKTSH